MIKQESPIIKKWIWVLLGFAVFFFIASLLGNVAILLLLSSLVAYIFNPLVTRLASIRFLGRTSATVISFTGLIVALFTVLFFLLPHVIKEFKSFFDHLPSLVERLDLTVTPYIEKYFDIKIPRTWNDVFNQIYSHMKAHGDLIFKPASDITKVVFGTTFRALFFLASLFMFPLFVFFLLKDFPQILDTIDTLVPKRYKITVRSLAKDIDLSLSAFLHGQFTVMLILGTLYSVGYSIVGIPLALGVGLLTGLLCFIPYLGAASGFVLALLMAIFSFEGWEPIWGVTIVFSSVQALDAVLITPKILGGKLGLQPLWIILALMIGGQIFGFLGVLLAVPSVAVLKILVKFTFENYKKSEFYDTDFKESQVKSEDNLYAKSEDR
ncbi:MAG: AI-2E family transporter [Deltaproteobacteria bacterium]|nr:AI-2E family transporter [Deltaproteobacteria bacterium]